MLCVPVCVAIPAADHRRRVIDEFDSVVSHLDGACDTPQRDAAAASTAGSRATSQPAEPQRQQGTCWQHLDVALAVWFSLSHVTGVHAAWSGWH